MERHQRNKAANGKILSYLSQTYRYPESFDNLLYTSQLLQADAIRCGVEHWRRNRGRCMGAVDLAAERLLARGLLVVHRLFRPLEGPCITRPSASSPR